jgi:heme/copper-type cytochrome/quinol oxidase subunit 2
VAFLEVDKDDEVVITVSSDVSDEVHLHGYDIKADVTPDQPAVIAFTADTPGVFEIELERSRRRVAQIQVNA